uniref:ribosomal protein L22 n=1 Tax=Chrysoglossum ornatum TaxID=1470420 RepID=UPI00286C5899|nr:ribosomal protein L22 [Chrysoglossum ornatum]WLV27289.1 ribosomal protein L22 [Chrysoglossum ornatum]
MIKNENSDREAKVLAQHICMSVFKARRVIDQIRGRSYEETLMILELMPYWASYPILKLVYSAAANASHNMGRSYKIAIPQDLGGLLSSKIHIIIIYHYHIHIYMYMNTKVLSIYRWSFHRS